VPPPRASSGDRRRTRQSYIADFACTEARPVVEVDGGQHANLKYRDEARSVRLAECGYRVLRFWNNEVLTNIDAVLHVIATDTLQHIHGHRDGDRDPRPEPSPKGGEERRLTPVS
jgi:very-short-patch-repair endonuclease